MKITRRWLLSSLVVATLLLAACSTVAPRVDAEARRALAPSGTLRVGVYPGSPTSIIVEAKTGQKIGIALDGRWGLENMAIAVPKEREGGAPALREFAERAKTSGLLQSIVARTGLRGSITVE